MSYFGPIMVPEISTKVLPLGEVLRTFCVGWNKSVVMVPQPAMPILKMIGCNQLNIWIYFCAIIEISVIEPAGEEVGVNDVEKEIGQFPGTSITLTRPKYTKMKLRVLTYVWENFD